MKKTSRDDRSKLCVILEDIQKLTVSKEVSAVQLDIRSIQNVWDTLFTKSPNYKNMELYAVYHKGNQYRIRAMSKKKQEDNILVLLQFSGGQPKKSITMVEEAEATKQVQGLLDAIYTHKENMKSMRRLMLAKMATSAAGVGGGAIYLYHKYNKYTRSKQDDAGNEEYTENRTPVHQVDKTCEKNEAVKEEYTENRDPLQRAVDDECVKNLINATDLATRFQLLGLPDHLGVIDKSASPWGNHKILVHALRDTILFLPECNKDKTLYSKIQNNKYNQITAEEIACVGDSVKKRLTEIMPRYMCLYKSPYKLADKPFDSGKMGKAYKAKKGNNNYVIKTQYTCYAFRNEIHAHVRLIGADIVPKVVDSFICLRETHTVYAIVMEELQGTFLDFLKERLKLVRDGNSDVYYTLGADVNKKAIQQIKDIYYGLINRGVYHTDLHAKNIMYRQTDHGLDFQFLAIDLGNAAISGNGKLHLNSMLWAPYNAIPYLTTKQQAYNRFKNMEDRIDNDFNTFWNSICRYFLIIMAKKFDNNMYENLVKNNQQMILSRFNRTAVEQSMSEKVQNFFRESSTSLESLRL